MSNGLHWDILFYMAEEKTTAIAIGNDVGSQVIARVDQLCQVGFVMPPDYNYVNAIKASMLVMQEIKDKNGRPATEVCTPQSIQSALFKMCTAGLDASKKQCYLIIRGSQLCLHESYFGKVLQVKRIFPDWEPQPRVIYEGDEFLFDTDEKGRRRLLKHEQKLENLDHDFVGAYIYLPCLDGGKDLYVMTKRQILASWSKSSSREQTTHKTFVDKMASKTIVNSACNMIINSTPALAQSADDDEFMNEHQPIDVPTHEVQELNPDEIPVAEIKAAPEPKVDPEKEDF